MRIYLDHAASSPILPCAYEVFCAQLANASGNPSATHTEGRQAKSVIEQARKDIANIIQAHPNEIVFTSGGTESNNMALMGAVRDFGINYIITTSIEHACVQNTLKAIEGQASNNVKVVYVDLNPDGSVNLAHLRTLLQEATEHYKILVSIIHTHNELGTINNIDAIGLLCIAYKAYFHTDMVQSFGHLPISFKEHKYVHFASASAHKFGGGKGVGFLFMRKGAGVSAYINGGGQERNLRGGTENVPAIAAMAAALKYQHAQLQTQQNYMLELQQYFKALLIENIPNVSFNGNERAGHFVPNILSANLPFSKNLQTLLFQLDLAGVAASAGAACSAGALQVSSVMRFLNVADNYKTLRFSFAMSNTKEELEKVTSILKNIVSK